MKAIVLDELGEPEKLKLEEWPDPTPGPGEVLIRLKAAALNHRDVWIRTGRYAGIKLPIILGSDGAGEVVDVGPSVDSELLGRPVVIYPAMNWGSGDRAPGADFKILGLPDNGTYAQLLTVPASQVFQKPPSLSYEEAAALPLALLTAYRTVVTRAQVRAGETCLITGIGGGVSSFVLQIARAIGARVLVTSGSDVKLDHARQIGAAGGANYRTQDWGKEILVLCENRGLQAVIDSAGGETFEKALELVSPGGRVVTYGATTGPAKQIEIRRIFWKQLNVLGTTMGTAQEFEAALKFYDEKQLRPVIDQVFPLSEAAAAHRRMEEGGQFGKIVLKIE
ncbi:MAG: zinc-binding dehydrogenase [Acidobacteria bacterium]|nr:zinc-binding dehydrogenase [Acidobacteriota bacterium]